MSIVKISDSTIRDAANRGDDDFLKVIVTAISDEVGGELNTYAIQHLNKEQITLWGYYILREEVMDGGFVQLIHNGYGPFFFDNPFAKILKDWGIRDLSKLLFGVRNLYYKKCVELTKECSDEEFMSLFEKHPEFDEYDDNFVENEELFTSQIAYFVDEHLEQFVLIE